MSLIFDHVVLLVNDLDEAAADFTRLGFNVLERADINASHGSTVFRFVSLDDGSYILLTAFSSDEARAKHRLGPCLENGEGHADWSFTVADAASLGAELKQAGFPVSGPVDVSNVVEGGHKWGLDLLMLGRGAQGDPALPFVVSDNEGREHRIPAPVPHANGSTAMRGILLASIDAETVVKTLVALGGREIGASPDNLGARRIDFGATWVDVATSGTAIAAGKEIREVVLTSTDAKLPANGQVLDMTLSHGGAIRLIPA